MSTSPTPDPRDAFFATDHLSSQIGRKAGEASLWILIFMVLKIIVQFGSIAVLSRLVPPEEFGVFALAVPTVMLATALSNFGLTQAIVQKPSITHSEVNTLFWSSTMLAGVITFAMAALSFPIAGWFDQPELVAVISTCSLAVLFSTVTGQYLGITRRKLQLRDAEFVVFVAQLLAAVIGIIGAYFGMSYWALVLQLVAAPVLSTIAMPVVTGWHPSSPFTAKPREAFHSLRFGSYVTGCSILDQVSTYSGTYIVRSAFNVAESGIFYRTRNLGDIVASRIMMPLSSAFVPALSRVQHDPLQTEVLFSRLLTRASMLALPLGVIMAVAAEPLTLLFLGNDWAGAAPLMLWMSLFTFRSPSYSALQNVLMAMGEARSLFFVSLARVVIVILAMAFTSQFGLTEMVAIVMLAELFVVLPIMCIVAVRCTPLTAKTILRDCWLDIAIAFAIVVILRVLLVPLVNGQPILVQFIELSLAVGAIYLLRILLSAEMRADALRVAGRFLPQLRTA